MKIVVFSLGCKVNQYESQVLAMKFFNAGFDVSEQLEFADIYVINTCSVTGEADKKSRQAVSRVRKFNPEAKIYICGCSSQNSSEAFYKKENVVFVMGTNNKNQIFNQVMSDINSGFSKDFDSYSELPLSEKSRIYVKIQDGCNRFCSYCIVPYLRGRSRSRTIDSIKQEVEILATKADEIVLTGVDISAYGLDIGTNLTELLNQLSDIAVRKRLGSLECGIVDESFLEAVAKANVCEHFHLSLQSGSDAVLKKMNRHYTTAEYKEKVDLIKKVFPCAGITTDIIAGFPGETQMQHLETVEFAYNIGFSDIHVFPYSQRKGTVAANMKQIPVSERVGRANELIKVKNNLIEKFIEKNFGRQEEVLIEETIDGYGVGHTRNFLKAYIPNATKGLLSVTLKNKFNDGIKGELL